MNGSGVHTFTLVNSTNKPTFVKFHWRPSVGAWLLSFLKMSQNKPRQTSALTCMQRYASYTMSNHFLRICYKAWFQTRSWAPQTPCICLPSGVQGNQRHREPCRPSWKQAGFHKT